MVLQDNKLTAYVAAGAAVVIGLVITSLFARHGVVPIIVGLAFIGAGAFMLFRIRKVTIELDKAAGTMHILLQGLKSKEERNLGLAQIKKLLLRKLIETQTTRTSAPGGSGFASRSSTTTYHRFVLVFVTDQNEEIMFDFGRVKVGLMNMLTHPEEKIRQGAQDVANFLNVQLDAATPSTADVLGALRDGLAVKFQKVH